MNFSTIYRAALRKRAAAVLTPEAEQAAMQPPEDPATAGGQPMAAPAPPPEDPMAAGGGMPQPATGPQGGQLPPEIMQDQGFIQWLASQGVQLDPQSGMFIDVQSGQPIPAEAIMQAYQIYMEQMQATQGAPAGDQMAAGAEGAANPAGAAQAPAAPEMAGGMPAAPDAAAQGAVPPELMQDPGFAQFLQVVGIAVDPQSGQAVDMQSGQPLPPEALMQVAQAYMQQAQAAGAPQDAAAQPAAPGGSPESFGIEPEQQTEQQAAGLPQEVMEQLQSSIDASIQSYTAQLDKKIETLLDKLETVKQAVESLRDTDDKRDQESKDEIKAAQEDLAAELSPVTKTASASNGSRKPRKSTQDKHPVNIFELLIGK